LIDTVGRSATCSVASIDLGEWLVRNGFALDWPQYSKGRYDGAQRDAEPSAGESGRAATSSRGSIVLASVRMENDRLFG
jgi:hypothetical protein